MLAPKTNRMPILVVIAATVVINSLAHGQSVLYDNTHVNVFEGKDWGTFPESPNTFAAQSFRLGNSGTISEITIGMSRFTNGFGTVNLSLWDDAEGVPGSRVAEIGTVDVAQLEDSRSIALPMVTFEPDISGLVPNQLYRVYIDHTELSGNRPSRNNSVVYGSIRHNENTKSPPVFHFVDNIAEPVASDWMTFNDLGFGDEWLQVRVVAAGDPFAIPDINIRDTYEQSFDSFDSDGG